MLQNHFPTAIAVTTLFRGDVPQRSDFRRRLRYHLPWDDELVTWAQLSWVCLERNCQPLGFPIYPLFIWIKIWACLKGERGDETKLPSFTAEKEKGFLVTRTGYFLRQSSCMANENPCLAHRFLIFRALPAFDHRMEWRCMMVGCSGSSLDRYTLNRVPRFPPRSSHEGRGESVMHCPSEIQGQASCQPVHQQCSADVCAVGVFPDHSFHFLAIH